MATMTVTAENFADTVKQGIVLLDFWASWCGPCRVFAPIFEGAAERHADVVFGKVDTDQQTTLARAFEVRSIPTLMVLREGVLLGMLPGVMRPEAIDDLIRKVKALDMDEVHRAAEPAGVGSESARGA